MRTAMLGLSCVCACTAAASKATVAPSQVPRGTGVAAPAGWDAVTGATYADYVDQLSDDAGWALAIRLAREGNVACPRTVYQCGYTLVDEPRDDETVADPCLRRAVLRRVLGRDGRLPDDLIAAAPALAADQDLLEVAAMDRTDDQRIALAAAAEHAGWPPAFLSGIAPDRAADAVRRLHVAAAVDEVDGRRDPGVLLAVAADPTFPSDVRADAMFVVEMYATGIDASAATRDAGDHLAALAAKLVGDDDCKIAAKAAELRATLAGDDRDVPRRPQTRDRAAMLRALCRVREYDGGDGEQVIDTFVPATGLEVVYPDGYPDEAEHQRARDIIPRNDGHYGQEDLRNFFDGWIGLALDQAAGRACEGDACDRPSVGLTFDPDEHGNLVLTRVTITRNAAGEQRQRDEADRIAQLDHCAQSGVED
jgi:hypothetical protein